MRGEIVAIDLETTGLDPQRDAILEVGLVRFREGEILETYSTLVDVEREIPPGITFLTGIRQEDMTGAPKLRRVLADVADFAGLAPLVGHNISFDLSFLQPWGLLRDNLALDTYELAAVLLPTAPRYNLNSLAQQLSVPLNGAHRALTDATATVQVYWTLWQRILDLPLNTLQEIANAARGLPWSAAPVFEAALRERARTAFDRPQRTGSSLDDLEALFGAAQRDWRPLRPNAEIRSLDPDRLAALLEPGGLLAQRVEGYEHRPEQITMLRAVTEAFNRAQHLMVEAGTGTGKSMAYLIPAIYWAITNNERVVISTNTINLQDQLINKDIPLLRDILGMDFKAAVVKGRSNYLCPRRLMSLRRRRPTSIDELRIFAKILIWLLESTSGDRGEINLRGPAEIGAWMRLSAEDEGCTLERCHEQMHGACPFYKARREAENAHLLIVNHALLLSDVAVGSRVLPEYRYLILDEAHHLEEATTNGLSFRIDQAALRRQLADLGGTRSGILGDLLRHARGTIPESHVAQLTDYVQIVEEAIKAMEFHIGTLFSTVYHFLRDGNYLRPGEYMNQVRVTDAERSKPDFAKIQEAWTTLSQFTTGIADAMSRLMLALGRLKDFDIPDYEDIVASVGAAARHLNEVHQQLAAFTTSPDGNTIYWIEVGQEQGRLSLHAAPLNVGPLIEKHLWYAKDAVIMTSATLQTAGSFDYLQGRLQATNVKTLDVGSPFNYRASTLLYLPTDMPEPTDKYRYQNVTEQTLIELAAATGGRMMVLFTSYTQLRQTAQAIAPRLALGDIAVFDQSDGSSRQALLEGFKGTRRAVLLGTRSFWEGVDIPGEDLSVLVITRLPFAVPTDPIFAARAEQFANSFNDYSIPDAILRFRQGFGRLIRTRTDRGVVVILDRRILSKNYGQHFLASLPECTVLRKPLASLAEETVAWLERGRVGGNSR